MRSEKRLPENGSQVRKRSSILFLSCALAWMLLACDRDNQSAQAKGQNPPASAASDSTLPTFSLPADNAPAPAFDGNRALQYVKDIVAFGPRPVGSANHKTVEDYIISHLKGDAVEQDTFTADTP